MKTEITDAKILKVASTWANETDISVHHHSFPFDELIGTSTSCGDIDNHALNEELCQYLKDNNISAITVVDNDQFFSGEGDISCLFASIETEGEGAVIEYIVNKAGGSLRLDGFISPKDPIFNKNKEYIIHHNNKYYYGFESE